MLFWVTFQEPLLLDCTFQFVKLIRNMMLVLRDFCCFNINFCFVKRARIKANQKLFGCKQELNES